MTVASKDDAKDSGFQEVFDGLSSKFLEPHTWCHIFLTDLEDKAELFQM
jgi:hypothetical protein